MLEQVKFIILIPLLILFGCDKDVDKPKKSQQYTAITITEKTIADEVNYLGIIKPTSKTIITSSSDGYITKINKRFGEYVQKGDVLIEINDKDAVNQLLTSIGDYILKRKEYDAAKRALSDNQTLLESGAIAQKEINTAKTALESAKIGLIKAEFQMQSIMTKFGVQPDEINANQLDDISLIVEQLKLSSLVKIKAPTSGFFVPPNLVLSDDDLKPIRLGSKIDTGITIGAIADLTNISIEIKINEFEIDKIKTGMPANITVLTQPDKQIKGQVDTIDLFRFQIKADEPTKYPVIITAKSEWKVFTGSRSKVNIVLGERTVLMVPIDAINDISTNPYVILKSGTKQLITLGKTHFNQVEVTEGLQSGDIILKYKP